MASFNQVILMGNLTRDLELKYTPSKTAVARVGIATNRKWKNSKTNEMQEEVTFQELEIWGKGAEVMAQYLGKGSPVFVQGRLKTESWIDKGTQQKKSRNLVVVENFKFIGAKKEGAGAGGAPAGGEPAGPPVEEEPALDENGIPF